MLFGLLGSVEVTHDGQALPVGGTRERFVLATLLLNAGRPISVDELIDALWTEPPPSARAVLHNLISSVRRRLRIGVGSDGLIVSRHGGYELHLDRHELDLLEFRRLSSWGQEAAAVGDHKLASWRLNAALSLWRGPALSDIAYERVAEVRQVLHEERFAAADARLAAELSLGHSDEVLRELPALLGEYPYRERLHEKHMLALAGAGRTADALAEYRRVRRLFVDELGVEPGNVLRELEQRILRGEVVTSPRSAVLLRPPRQLPTADAALIGRDELVTEITTVLGREQDWTSHIVVLVGQGGIGKTALARTAADRLVDAFPDGQLYADMRGSRDDPVDPHTVAGRFLRALGVNPAAVPEDPEERIALYRSWLAGGRVLVVLDDVASESQVRPLVPGTTGGRVIVTSRHRLGALTGAARWMVPVLTTGAAVQLLIGIVGRERVDAEPDAATEIVELCAHLPLAVTIAGARLAVHTHWTLEQFRRRLAEERCRLDELAIGDLDVRASIALSYWALDPLPRKLFRLLGLVKAADWPAWVAGPLLDMPDQRGARVLDFLIDAHLVAPVGQDRVGQNRFRLHDLVGEFATERALAEESHAHRADAVSRLLSRWLALAAEADEHIPHDLVRAPDAVTTPQPSSVLPIVRHEPLDWFEVERRILVDAVGEACRHGRSDIAGALALRLSGFLSLRSYYDDWENTLRKAISCVRESHAARLLARLLSCLFVVRQHRDRNADLPAIAAEGLAMARALDERELEIRALRQAGLAAERIGRLHEAVSWHEQAVAAARHPEVPSSLLRASLDSLAVAHCASGCPRRAASLLEEALAIGSNKSLRTALLLYHYGQALIGLGRLDDAETALTTALRTTRQLGHDHGSAYLEQTLADVHIRQGRRAQAAARLDWASRAHHKLGNREGLAMTLRSSGDLAATEGSWTDADMFLRRSLDIWRPIGPDVEVARTLARLARAHVATGNHAAATTCRREYRSILRGLHLDDTCLCLPPLLAG